MNIAHLLTALDLVRKDDVSAGQLEIASSKITDKDSVFEKIRSFGGTGWICMAGVRQIQRISPGKPLKDLPADAWPLCAELADGPKSLHLVRSDNGWVQSIIEKKRTVCEDSLIIKVRMSSRDGRGRLVYEVAWELTDVDGLEEIRPASFRFAGFEGDGIIKNGA